MILGPVFDELLAPDRVARIVTEIQKQLNAALLERERRADARPAEIVSITDRIERLRTRLAEGDPDLEPDEIEAAIAKADAKRKELMQAQPEAQEVKKLMTLVPNAAAAYRRQVHDGLKGDPRQATKARAILRKLVGTVRLVPERDGLYAEFYARPAALLQKAVGTGVGTCGSGGVLCAVPTVRRTVRLK